MFGVSVYLGYFSEGEQEAYLRRMMEAGFTSIFTSLHIPEDDASLYAGLLRTLGSQAKNLGLELMADLSPRSFEPLGLNHENINEISKWGVTGIRADYGIGAEEIARLSQSMKIALNASTLTRESFQELKRFGLNIKHTEAWHNFYPRPETGLERRDFILHNKWLSECGMTVAAFAPGDGDFRGPLFKGLPTLEDHRGASPFTSALDLLLECYVDKAVIGDPSICKESIRKFQQYQEGVIEISIEASPGLTKEEEGLIGLEHKNRMDSARDVIRSEPARMHAMENGLTIAPGPVHDRMKGSVTLDNSLYGRYQGELQIVKRNLPADPKVNVVGNIVEKDLGLLTYLYPGKAFKFYRVN
ncbi:DUF871 domain-containing protein [Peribacillus kribbensis]|uniref:DUF871 domain-containing protein n=1 Tax=Peribacillus kribbensis TaxID=356658 RepID=UPI000403999E|nr:MupG family TIM beta-alpha barrel fold protein [Peribacillus kribbensis]